MEEFIPTLNKAIDYLITVRVLITLFVLLYLNTSMAHQQHVHQYIVREAYELLINQLGFIVPEMHNFVGGLGSDYYGSYAWHKPYLTAGAWREDMEDPIFNYDFLIVQGVNIALVSISHFWDADSGDMNNNLFPIVLPYPPYPSVNIGPYENAYDKFLRYAEGNWVLWFPDSMFCTNKLNGHQLLIIPGIAVPPQKTGIPVKYFSITEFYNNRELELLNDQNGEFYVFDLTTLQFISPDEAPTIIVHDNIRNRIAWEVLGRMCHLLADLSVPVHTHRDEHGLQPDSYENWMGSSAQPHLYWNYSNSGAFINPYTTDNDPLHFLMYTMLQQADHFGSNGPGSIGNGNDNLLGDPRPKELQMLNALNIPSYGEPTTSGGPWHETSLENIRDKTFPYAIRATAGLLYWFAIEVGLFCTDITEESTTVNSFHLFQNYPNPFNPSTKIKFSIPEYGLVQLIVYNLLGKEVALLLDEEMSSGSYEVEWNASEYSSGVYFYQLTFKTSAGKPENYLETKKMILVR